MLQSDIDYVKRCIKEDIHKFYTWSKWLNVRAEVLEQDKNECQDCKSKSIYTPATTVHHINYVCKHPELALEKTYEYEGSARRNMISLCHECYEKSYVS